MPFRLARLGYLFFLLPFAVFADTAVQPTGATPWWANIVLALFGLLSTVITAVLLPTWKKKLEAQAAAEEATGQKSQATALGLKVEHFAEVVVADIDATLKPELAKMLEDGKLDDVERARLRDLALTRMKVLLGQQGLGELSSVLGLVGEAAINSYLAGVVEKAVDTRNLEVAKVTS